LPHPGLQCNQAQRTGRYVLHSESNPVRELPPAHRPRPERKEAAYFENEELPRLFAHMGVNALFDPGPSGKSGEEMSDIRRSTWRRCRRSTAANSGSVRMPKPVVEDCWRKMRPPRDGDQAGDIR
jgi:hypothetical protein